MELSETIHRLRLFGIPAGEAPVERRMLARLVAAESLSLAELQTARDIVRLSGATSADGYLFLAAMFLSLRGGSTFLRPEKGEALLTSGGRMDDDGGDDDDEYTYGEYCADVRSAWPNAIAAAESIRGDVVLKRMDAIGECWFFQRNAAAVDAVSRGLSALSAERGGAPLLGAELAAAASFRNFTLNEEQLSAVKTAVERMFTVVTGGPGTGKTTIVFAVLRAMFGRGLSAEDVALVAPTARAAQRMGEAVRAQRLNADSLENAVAEQFDLINGCTIHSLLGGFPPNWRYTAENSLPLKLVVVDEASMVDVQLMRALVEALPQDCRLVLLGDKDQLPSVEAGAVLGDIVVDDAAACVVRLVASNRFTGPLAVCASAVKDGDVAGFMDAAHILPQNLSWLDSFDGVDTENKCFLIPSAGGDMRRAGRAAIAGWAEHYGLSAGGEVVRLASDPGLKDDAALTEGVNSPMARALFAALDRSRILAVVKNGPLGLRELNELLAAGRFGGRMPANPFGSAGVPVIVTRNTPARNLFNGDMGVTVEGRSGIVALFPRGDKVVACPAGLLPECELAYAITVHKSQGSEFENVMVVLPENDEHPLLSRQLVYTGITRAKRRAVVLASESALKTAFGRTVERDTGISLGRT